MRITRLYLRNYRVYEEPLDLEVPPGLVGIYGVNGAGKSVLLEAVLFALWGASRTNKDEVRTSGINAECVAEVQFEHEGTLYLVRRTLSGAGAQAQAEAHANGSQVSEGVRDTERYVHSVLGMDDHAFRASVFAEQKQLAAFSARSPAERRKLVLGLLGIAPLDSARDQARKDAREARARVEDLRPLLADLDQLQADVSATAEAAGLAEVASLAAAARAAVLTEAAAQAEQEHRRLDQIGRRHDALSAEGRAARRESDEVAARIESLEGEAAGLAHAGDEMAEAQGRAAGLDSYRDGLAAVDEVVAALDAYRRSSSALPAESLVADPGLASEAAEAATRASAGLAELQGRRSAAVEVRGRAAASAGQAAALSKEANCPMCGQELGPAFGAVQAHWREELATAEAALAVLTANLDAARQEAARCSKAAEVARRQLAEVGQARLVWERAKDRQGQALERLRAAVEAAPPAPTPAAPRPPAPTPAAPTPAAPTPAAPTPAAPTPAPAAEGTTVSEGERLAGGRAALAAQVEAARVAAEEAAKLAGKLERAPAVSAELQAARQRQAVVDAELASLRQQVAELGHQPDVLASAARAAQVARTAAGDGAQAAQAAQLAAVGAAANSASAAQRLADGRAQHDRLAEMGDLARHVGRASDLLGTFRNEVVGLVGPRLSKQAEDLFSELTDHEYDGLEVDPESYEIRIRDHGVTYGMDRFSGSETDLANLALRVAISEQVMLLSGGAVGLLVLDEVFGPLDADRKDRMLAALERLKGRFRQVMVVTHDNDLKQQLPNAIEVVKLPGRRATARVV